MFPSTSIYITPERFVPQRIPFKLNRLKHVNKSTHLLLAMLTYIFAKPLFPVKSEGTTISIVKQHLSFLHNTTRSGLRLWVSWSVWIGKSQSDSTLLFSTTLYGFVLIPVMRKGVFFYAFFLCFYITMAVLIQFVLTYCIHRLSNQQYYSIF